MKKNVLLTVIFLISLCLQPFTKMDNDIDIGETIFLDEETEINQIKNAPIITSFEKNEILPTNEIQREFNLNDTISENVDTLSINNCEEWDVNGEFSFKDIRTEKLINGDAESTEDLWTDYIPSHYEGNVTRESSPKQGSVISGNNSWYFDIKSQDHTTIVGFDNEINLDGNSVIFSMSYSLLSNSLGTSYDSNICIRLFFQFDIYIFIWFEGNTAVLSNVTGPGGYADLIVDGSSFNGAVNEYSLNITDLGLELFNQKPDQLRSFAVQTWGEESYQMEFMFDDISLTDLVTPDSINLAVNSHLVAGETGIGFVLISSLQKPTIDYNIQFTSITKIFWDCEYYISGICVSNSISEYFFENYETISIIESCNESIGIPDNISIINYEKWISKDWIVSNILIDSISQSYEISEDNSTHNRIKIEAPNINNFLEISYTTQNQISNVNLSSNQITHDELLQINTESEIMDDELEITILDSDKEIIYKNSTNTNQSGSSFFLYRNSNSQMERNNYTIRIFWQEKGKIGIGLSWFEITTKPTRINSEGILKIVEYQQPIILSVDYQNIEDNTTIDFATVTYNWKFGSNHLVQTLDGIYIAEIDQIVSPGIYNFTLIGTKTDFATAILLISIEVVFSGVDFELQTQDVAIPGETIEINSIVKNNFSDPLQNLVLKFSINNQFLLQTMTNETGHATIYYLIPSNYFLNTLNISCTLHLNESEILNFSKTISIEIFDLLRSASIDTPYHISSISEENTTFFSFHITYSSIGEMWQTSLPEGFTPLSATIITGAENITASISQDGFITWGRFLDDLSDVSDILLVENPVPVPDFDITENKNEILIEINIHTNSIPYKDLEITILKSGSWSRIENWFLFSDDIDVTDEFQLEIFEKYISFVINSENENSIYLKLIGTIESIVTITPSTIVLGIGIASLTVASTFLLFKKKSNVSLDIQL